MLSFETSEWSGVLVVAFEDREESRDERQSNQRQWLYHLIEERTDPRFAFDLRAVTYLTSSDIGFLITLRRRITGRQGQLVLFAVDPHLIDLLRTMKLYPLFEFATDLAEAMTRLGPPASS